MKRPTTAAGEDWFIQLAEGCTVLCVHVAELTDRTVVLRQVADLNERDGNTAVRYVTRDIKFLECVRWANR
jgi:hypothetical protein